MTPLSRTRRASAAPLPSLVEQALVKALGTKKRALRRQVQRRLAREAEAAKKAHHGSHWHSGLRYNKSDAVKTSEYR